MKLDHPSIENAAPSPTRTGWGRPALIALLSLEAVVLALCVTGAVVDVVRPASLATQVAHNSEAYALALLLTPVVVWVGSSRPVPLPLVTGIVLVEAALLVGVLAADDSRVHTLNEPVLAALLLTIYVTVRPRRPWLALASPAVVLACLAAPGSTLVLDQAESVVALVLVPITLDLVAPWVLGARPRRDGDLVRLGTWLAVLVLAPLALTALAAALPETGDLAATVDYAKRGTEGWWGAALVLVGGALAAWPSTTAPARPAR